MEDEVESKKKCVFFSIFAKNLEVNVFVFPMKYLEFLENEKQMRKKIKACEIQ